MQVEITKMVYQHPWYVSSVLLYSQMAGWGSIYKPHWESSRWGQNLIFCYWPNAGRVRSLTTVTWSLARSTDQTLMASDQMPPDASDRNCVALEPLWTQSDAALRASGRLVCYVRSRWKHCRDNEQCHRSVRSLLRSASGQCLIIAADACCCLAPDQTCPVTHRATSGHLCRAHFFAILRPAWFQSSCLDFAWPCMSSMHLHMSFFRCWSSDHHVTFVQVMFCILLNYKTNTCKFNSPIWLCWSSNTKIQSKWAKGPFSLQSPPFGDWWQHDQSKLITKIWNLKTIYLLGCNARDKVIWC